VAGGAQQVVKGQYPTSVAEHCPAVLLLLLQLLSDALPSFSADQLSQLMWAYAQFGHQPAPALMTAVLAQTEAQVAALQVG
jgi:hypothetical protein